jgi:iron(III) transport system substrate-binding protein
MNPTVILKLHKKMLRQNAVALSLLLALAVTPVTLVSAKADDQLTPAMKQVMEQAKKEGAVRFFVGSPRYPQSANDMLSQAFEKKFGFPLHVSLASLGAHPPVVNRLVSEGKMGIKPAADVFPTGEGLLNVLHKGGVIETVDWAALGVPTKLISEKSDGVLVRVNPRNVIYNTKLVKAADAPHSYEDLLDPKWKGKIVAPSYGSAFGGLALVMDEQKAYDFVRKLVNDQKLALVQTFSDVPTKVANGEYAIGFGINANISGLMDRGAPVANAPLKKAWGSTNYAVILKNAANQAAGKAFVYFICCTVEGQQAIYKAAKIATFDTPNTELYEIGGAGRGVAPTFEFATQQELRIDKAMAKILGF